MPCRTLQCPIRHFAPKYDMTKELQKYIIDCFSWMRAAIQDPLQNTDCFLSGKRVAIQITLQNIDCFLFFSGVRAAIQDPLQNGIIDKQKVKPKGSGTKRQLSLNDTQQGIIADPLSYASSKRRHSSEVPVNDPFALINQSNLNRSLNPTNQQVINVKDFQRPSNDVLSSRRPKSANTYLTTNVASSPSFIGTGNNVLAGNFVATTGSVNMNMNSSLNLCQSLGITQTGNSLSVRQNSIDSTYSMTSSSKVTAAPNVTITQGMLVSLPTSVLQNSQQNVYSIGSHIKDLISQSSPSRIVQPVSQSSQLALKQVGSSYVTIST